MKFESIAFHHFGCKVNFAEASTLARSFQDRGIEVKDFHDQADVYVISTCVVTSVAEKKCRAAIRQAHKLNPSAKIAVIGCFSELKPEELAVMEGVDLVLGHSGKFQLVEELEKLEDKLIDHIGSEAGEVMENYHGGLIPESHTSDRTFVSSFSSGDRTRSFLKIQDGCDYYCSYCTIPLARGHSRSNSIENVVNDVKKIIALGIREIVLTGVNIGDFGRNSGENFLSLIQAIELVDGIDRIRISSIEPDLLTDEIIEFVASSKKFLPHFHLPLQSGCDKVLKAMHRKYTTGLYQSRVNRIKALMPHACIAADVIVGFPDETDEDFNITYKFLQDAEISYLHVFTYSKRANTLAAKSEHTVSDREKKERSNLLHALSDLKKAEFYHGNIGREESVLFESDNSEGYMHGFTENYIKVKKAFNPEDVNQIIRVRLDKPEPDGTFLIT